MSPRLRLVVGVALAAVGLIVFLLPFSLLMLPNPSPVVETDLGKAATGVYLSTAGTVWRLFPFGAEQTSFPTSTAGLAAPDAVVLVKYRNLAALAEYAVHAYPSGTEVRSAKTDRRSQHVLEIRPAALGPGRYYVTKAREGMWTGTDYVYFTVRDAAPH